MSARGTVWLIGLPIASLIVLSLAWDGRSRELSLPAGFLALAICTLSAEATSFLSIIRRAAPLRGFEAARQADGVVDVVPMSGVEAESLSTDPRWRRFTGLGSGEAAATLSPTNPALLGRVALISVFVGRDGRAWTDAEIDRAHDSLTAAGLWIEREASRREVPLNIELPDTYFRVEDDWDDPVEVAFHDEGDDVGPMEARSMDKGVIGASRAAARLKFVDVVDMIARINPQVGADEHVWLFHLRRAGRSMAIPAAESDVPGVGLAVCFAREASFPEPLVGPGRVDPSTVAHEVLHLFGASDKYGIPLRTFAPGAVTSRDVMRLQFNQLSRMTIEDLTASEIGWGGTSAGPKKNRL